jgi:ammonium transporter, Amt family
VIAGLMLWGFPSSPYEGYATVNPLGNFIGAIIMFFVLGFVPGWVLAKILDGFGLLRVPRQVELMGLDFRTLHEEELARQEIRNTEKALA